MLEAKSLSFWSHAHRSLCRDPGLVSARECAGRSDGENKDIDVGFIGLSNVGGKLARSVLGNGLSLSVHDISKDAAQGLLDSGAGWADTPAKLAEKCDVTITCLPSPPMCAQVVEGEKGVLQGLATGKIWAEMSMTDEAEVKRLGELVSAEGADPVDCPVSGGCHRAATGNISIFAGCERDV